ncbi:hypothetical protein LSTR_LSTR005999 [Laodelphax striatellus]|uniref:Uncharacterized protein n=1 Tax=Laodelphax striatellus TaxID=195883 RepID=A0A482XNK8_LAOST|nr:hypothetical protein LSTR_LSTR005999 [Laodelphax striatellus]
MITKRSTLLLVLAVFGSLSLSLAASKNDKIKEEKEENKSKELVNNATVFKTKNINKTIARVEAMLAKNPQLPRLTRGEIIALLDNITRTDALRKGDKGENEDKRRREEKSLLVVLPFIPYNESSKTGLEELYTMEPMTKFVTEGTTASGERKKSSNTEKKPEFLIDMSAVSNTEKKTDFLIDMSAASSSERAQVVESSIRFENPHSSYSSTTKVPVTTPTPAPHKRRRKPSSMKPIIVAPQEQRPVYVHKAKTSSTTQPPTDSDESSVEWRPYTAYDSPLVLTQRPSTVKLPLPETSSSVEDPNIPKNHKPEGHQVFVTMPQLIMSSSSAPAYHTKTTTGMPVEIVTSRTVGTTKRPRKKPKTTTTRTTSKEVDDQVMFSGWKPAVAASFNKPEKKHKITTTTTTTPMPMPDISVAAENLPTDMKKILGSLGLMPGEADNTQKYQNSMEKPTIPTSPIDFKPLNPVIDPSSYVSFKRIPDKVQNSNKGGSVMDNDMKQILASFGLMSESGNNYNRRGKMLDEEGSEGRMMGDSDSDEQGESYENVKKKSHANFTLEDINTDALSDEMKDMLADLGVLKGSNSKRRNGKGHIFNPVTQSALLENPEQAERISKVLIDIKKLSEDNKTHQLNPEEIRAHLYNITAAVLSSSEDEDGDKKINANPGLNSISNGWNSQEAGDEEIKFGGDQTFDGYEPDEEELLRIQNNHKFGSSDDIGSAPSSSFFPEKEDDDSISTTRYLGIFNKSLQSMNGQPDPLSNEELHQLQDSFKNEVKRQQPDNATSTTSEASVDTTSEETVTTSEAPESSSRSAESSSSPAELSSSSEESSSSPVESSSSTTEASTTVSEEPSSSSAEDSVPAEANEPTMTPSTTTADSSNIRDLEESFGGDTPTQRPNGLYFLLDWNSFLRVGQDNRTVNLSFSPKVGDPRNFIQVNVP